MKNYFEGIKTEEEIEAAVEIVASVLGPVGRMIYEPGAKNILYNATVVTAEHGKLWYGDLYAEEAVLNTLMEKLKVKDVILVK